MLEKKFKIKFKFGHTFAHAIEMITEKLIKKDYLRHGEAVGLGMLCELMMSNNGKKNDLYYFAEKILKKFGLPTKLKFLKKIDQKFMKGFIKEFF